MEFIIILLKMVILYYVILLSYYIIGKKKIDELSISDFLLLIILSNYLIVSIFVLNQNMFYIIITIILLLIIHKIMTYLSSYLTLIKYMYKDKSSFIIKNGKLKFKDLIKKKRKINDLLKQLDNLKIEDLEYGILENNGSLLKKINKEVPLPIIVEGQIQYLNLKLLNKNEKWLENICLKENVLINNTFYAFYKTNKLYVIKNNS